jgi:hypothetical protein
MYPYCRRIRDSLDIINGLPVPQDANHTDTEWNEFPCDSLLAVMNGILVSLITPLSTNPEWYNVSKAT